MSPALPECVFLTRHAETAAPGLFHGAESDVGLSEHGRKQADAAAEWFTSQNVTVVVSSAMTRAQDTAAPIAAACGVPHRVLPQLHERRVGALSGTTFDHRTGPWADTITRWETGDITYTTYGAESFAELQARLVASWHDLIESYPGGRPLVVAHGVVCKVLLVSLLQGWDVSGWSRIGRVSNLSVSKLKPCRDGWVADPLLVVPPPVSSLNIGTPTGVGNLGIRSEA